MRFTTEDGIGIDYHIHGEGHPILCLPGLTRNAFDFDDFINVYAQKARIIAMSFRGREPSDFDPDFRNYNVYREGEDAIELLNRLDIKKALWLGASRGGLVTMAMAPKHKARMAGVVLNDIGPELNFEGLSEIIATLGLPPSFKTPEQAAQSLKAAQSSQFPKLSDEDWLRIAKTRYHFDAQGAHLRYDPKLRDAVLEGGPDFDTWAGFEVLGTLPLGLIWGENSTLITKEQVTKMQNAHPEMKLATIPDCGHVPFLNEPESLALIDEIFEASFGV